MRWLIGNKSNLQNIVQVKENKFELNLSQKDYIPEDKESTDNVQYIQVVVDRIPSTFDIQQELIKVQKEYDSSDEINSFTINGVEGWLDKQTRLSIKNAIDILEQEGETNYTVWLGNSSIEMSIVDIKHILAQIEIYAVECYNVTRNHLNEIHTLSRAEVFKFDISKDYPSKLVFELNKD